MGSRTIKIVCKLCGRDLEHAALAEMTGGYQAIRCPNCSIVSAYPLPSIAVLKEYYSAYQATVEIPARVDRLVTLHAGIVEYLEKRVGRSQLSILDYGFGVGAFLKQALKRGHQLVGVDFSSQNCQQLRSYAQANSLNIEIIQLPEESLERLAQHRFDLITLFQVIEHALDPLELISSLARFQDRNGFIYLECPNNDALFLKVKNLIRNQVNREDFYDSLNPPQHLYGFNRQSMTLLLERAGYQVLEIGDYGFADSLHQVETTFWYPSIGEWFSNAEWHSFYGTAKCLIGCVEPVANKVFKAGGGLYALAKKI